MHIIILYHIQNRNYHCSIKTYKIISKYMLNNLMIKIIQRDV